MTKTKKPPVQVICFQCKTTLPKTEACKWSDPNVGSCFLCQKCSKNLLRF